jgi:hypothetical protein
VHTCKTGHGWAVDFQRHCRAPQRIYSFLGALLTARTSSRNSRIYSILGALLTARTSSRNSRILFLLMMGSASLRWRGTWMCVRHLHFVLRSARSGDSEFRMSP